MPRTVTLVTDQSGFANPWQQALSQHALEIVVRRPDELGAAASDGGAVVLDANAKAYDEDELLTAVAFARAVGSVTAVHCASRGSLTVVDDVIVELCGGLVARDDNDVRPVASAIARRLDRARSRRFEFVTVSPRDGSLLVVLGDGRTVLARRPLFAEDNGADVISIRLSQDAASAEIEMSDGRRTALQAADLAPSEIPAYHNVANGPIDGIRLGQRIRELRLEAGLTQAELARRTGIHRPNIARVEAGRHTPSLETLTRLASAIGVPTSRVLASD